MAGNDERRDRGDRSGQTPQSLTITDAPSKASEKADFGAFPFGVPLTEREFADMLRVPLKALQKDRREGRLPWHRVAGSIRIFPTSAAQYIDGCLMGGSVSPSPPQSIDRGSPPESKQSDFVTSDDVKALAQQVLRARRRK
jgi:hypothetical protein